MAKFIDLTGEKYGKLTVLGIQKREKGKIFWNCQCDCGNKISVVGTNLKNGHTKSCGCSIHQTPKNIQDLTGKRFGRLLVIEKGQTRKTNGGQSKATWKCQCDCGNFIEVDGEKLRKGHTTSCGCKKKELRINFEDLTGQRFGRLTVIRFLEPSERKSRQYNWLCQCDCGNEVRACANKLKNGLQQSCGCLKEEMKPLIGERSKKYKYSNKRLYGVWSSMIKRCYDKNNSRYKDYGGRGITVCKEWKNNYDSFAKWAFKSGYDAETEQGNCTIERKNLNKGYSPGNCCWISNKQQQRNKRTTRYIEYKGQRKSVVEWSEILNIPYSTLYRKCVKQNKSIEEILNT